MINILEIEPNEVSRDITGYAIGIMGPPGCGKTTLASKIPNALILATEPGYKAIPGVMAQDITGWTDVLQVAAQLRKPEAKEKYDVIAIDTLDELVFLATEFMLQSEGVDDISDILWGKGYSILEGMLRKLFRQIQQDYGLILIAHDGRKQDAEDKDLYYASLNFNRKVKRVVMGLLDILAYVEVQRGDDNSIMHFRDSERWEAKSRFANIVPSTEFSYEGLVEAVADAVGEDGTTDERKSIPYSEKTDLPTDAEFEKYLGDINERAMTIINETGKMDEVQEAIGRVLSGRKLSQAKVQDYYALRQLNKALDEIGG